MEPLKETQKRFDQLMRQLKNGDYKYKPLEQEKQVDWTAYSEAKVNELRSIINLIKEMVDAVGLPEKPVSAGQPAKDAKDLAKAILLQQYLQANERVAIGWIDLLGPRLGISSAFEWRSLARAYEREDVKFVLERVFELSTTPVQGSAHSFSLDSTGLEESRKENYESVAHSEKSSSYPKLTSCISNEFHVVTSYAFTENVGDCKAFGQAFALTAAMQSVERVELDAGFVSRDICTAIGNAGALPFVYPKKGITLKKKKSQAWKNMLLLFVANPQEWLRFYHERSNVESWHSAFKRRFSKPLQCKSVLTQATEVCARIIIENFAQLNTAFHERRIKLPILAA